MISRINLSSVNSNKPSNNNPNFQGLLDVTTSALQYCEENPMLNVAVLDLSTAIIPRTVVESQTNAYAGLEAFRRESSGLLINCIIPGFIVAGIAMAIQNPIMGGHTKMSDCWANEDTINLIKDYWQKADDKTLLFEGKNAKEKTKVYNTLKNILKDTKGVDGSELKSFENKDFDKQIKTITEDMFKGEMPKGMSWSAIKARRKMKKASKKTFKDVFNGIIEKTHASENIKIKGHVNKEGKEIFFSQNLKALVENAPKILKELVGGKAPEEFAQRATKLLNYKSLMGLGVILPLAIAAQPINRWVTAKTSGKKGAPIYKDFSDSKNQELTEKEKAALSRQKLISVGSMVGVALLSIMKKPSLAMFKDIAQFKGIFPNMDQARLISTATFASRMMASEDKNDLREATVRDIATFSSFYFLGDYFAKGMASMIEKTIGKKKGFKLINDLAPGEHKGVLKRIWHWTKNTALKSSDEIYGATDEITKYAKKMRGVCQLGNITFSLIALGIVIPKMYRTRTDKEREKELKAKGINTTKHKPPVFLNNMKTEKTEK